MMDDVDVSVSLLSSFISPAENGDTIWVTFADTVSLTFTFPPMSLNFARIYLFGFSLFPFFVIF